MQTQVFAAEETMILEAFSSEQPYLTLAQLRRSTSLPVAELIPALEALRSTGLLARLNTVVESYAVRETEEPIVSVDPARLLRIGRTPV